MSKVTEETIISDVLMMDKGTAPIFIKNGMHCLGCPASKGESIKDACSVHGIDTANLVKELNEYLESINNN